MQKLLIWAAAAALAACAGRTNEQAGAAPARDTLRGDTTAITHQIDTTRTGPPGVGGRPGNATVTPDSVPGVSDTTAVRDTSGVTGRAGAARDTALVGQDTSAPGGPGRAADTTTMHHDSTMMRHDTTSSMGRDSTNQR
jgi:hypothetical protein